MRRAVPGLLLALVLAGCVAPPMERPPERMPLPPAPQPAPMPIPPPEGVPPPAAPLPPPPTRRIMPLGAASAALLEESRTHQAAGRLPQAAASVERALRIESRQPLLWIELGHIRLLENNLAQAEALARKAFSLAEGDLRLEELATRLLRQALAR